ncbi:MAG: hypothetical protein ACXVQQ_07235 [Gaiellaceae bacterium]
MRVRLAGAVLLLVTAAPSVAAARTPTTLVLAKAHGRGSVTVSVGTAHLHGRIWLYRQGGAGSAQGKASLVCHDKMTDVGKGFNSQWFEFRIGPNAHSEMWQHTGSEPCTLTVSLTGEGFLTVSLRGY